MTAFNNFNDALGALEAKLETLKHMAEANGFLVAAMKNDGVALRQMEAEETRRMLRRQARAQYDPQTGAQPNAAVLAILEEILGRTQTAEIIPFRPRS